MITIDGIECREGFANIRKAWRQFELSEWYGEVEFTAPQKNVGDDSKAVYFGPLSGYKSKPIEISGTIYITKFHKDNNKLITGVEFVGSGVPIGPDGKKLIAPKNTSESIKI